MADGKRWRVVDVEFVNDEMTHVDDDTDLTSAELIGLSILAGHHIGLPHDASNVYWRAWQKIQAAVQQALDE